MYAIILNFLQNEVAAIGTLFTVIATTSCGVIAFKKYIKKPPSADGAEDAKKVLSGTEEPSSNLATSEDQKEAVRNHAIEVAERMEFLLKEFSESHYKLTHSMFARWLGYETATPLEALLSENEAPTFQTLTDIADRLGVSRDWLIDGNGQPFYLSLPNEGDIRKHIETIKSIEPESLCFVRSKSEHGEVSIVLQVNDYKFMTFNTTLHLSSHVGATGEQNLWELYKFIRMLKDEYDYGQKLGIHIYGRSLDEEQYEQLAHGHAYPGNIIRKYRPQCYWWDDLTDINYNYPIAKEKYAGHGKEFMDAQRIIRTHIEYNDKHGA